MSETLKTVNLSEIRTNPVALRELQTDDEKYQSLVKDVGRRGVLLPITVRQTQDEATEEVYYQIVDGLHRYSAACENGLEQLDVKILPIAEGDVVETQIVSNLVKVDTKPVEYTKALQRLMALNPTMTVQELADKISQSPAFVHQRFSLMKLDEPIQKLVDSGDIKLANAYALSKLPKKDQHEWVDNAMVQPPAEFIPAVQQRAKEIREANRSGKDANDRSFEPVARLRKLVDLKTEFENPNAGPALTAEFGVDTAAEGFALGVAWALNLDPHSIKAAEAKWNQQETARAEEKKRRSAIREEKRRQDAARKAEEAKAASGLSDDELDAEVEKLRLEEEKKKAEAEKIAAEKAAAEKATVANEA